MLATSRFRFSPAFFLISFFVLVTTKPMADDARQNLHRTNRRNVLSILSIEGLSQSRFRSQIEDTLGVALPHFL